MGDAQYIDFSFYWKTMKGETIRKAKGREKELYLRENGRKNDLEGTVQVLGNQYEKKFGRSKACERAVSRHKRDKNSLLAGSFCSIASETNYLP